MISPGRNENPTVADAATATRAADGAAASRPRSFTSRLLTLFLGYDVFLSYRRLDAQRYAEAMASALESRGLECFLDRDETEGGVELKPALRRAIRRSRTLVVILTRGVLDSAWVTEEVAAARESRRPKTIIPINVDGFLAGPSIAASSFAKLQSLSWLDEPLAAIADGLPSASSVDAIVAAHRRIRVRRVGAGLLASAIALIIALAAGVIPTVLEQRRQAAVAYAAIEADVNRLAGALQCLLYAARERSDFVPRGRPKLAEFKNPDIVADLETLNFTNHKIRRVVLRLGPCLPGDLRDVATMVGDAAAAVRSDLISIRERNLALVDRATHDELERVANHLFLTRLAIVERTMRNYHDLEDSEVLPWWLLKNPGVVSSRADFTDFMDHLLNLRRLASEDRWWQPEAEQVSSKVPGRSAAAEPAARHSAGTRDGSED